MSAVATDWMTAQAAYEHVLTIELVPDVAHRKLAEIIQCGKIPARDGDGNILPSDFWNTVGRFARVDIDFVAATATRNDYNYSQPMDAPIVPYATRRATGLTLSTRHLFECFPAIIADQPKPASRPPGTGLEKADGP